MAYELVFTALQVALGLLITISLQWTRGMKKDIERIVEGLAQVQKEASVLSERVSHREQTARHYEGVTDTRLDRIAGRLSDIGIDVQRLDATIQVCPSCPHPNGKAHNGDRA